MERVVSAAVSTRIAMGFGSGGGWRRGFSLAWGLGVAESGAGGLGKCIRGPFKCGVKLSFYSGSKSNVRQWKGWFRQPCRLALLWGLGVAEGGAGGFRWHGVWEWRRVAPGAWQVYTWAFQVRRKAFFLSVLKATLGSGTGGFGSRVDSHCYGVWEWRRVAPGDLASVYVGLSSSA